MSIESSSAIPNDKPTLTAIMPQAIEIGIYPRPMGMPSLRPLMNSARFGTFLVLSN